MGHDHAPEPERWKHDGVRVIKGDRLDPNTAQTPGMFRQAAIDHARVGAQKIWAGTVSIQPNAKTGVHHHGELESIIYVVRGRARMRWGDRLEYVAEAEPGDFIFVPPFVPHQEINASSDEPLECVVVRSDNEAVVVNITDVEPVEKPEDVYWIDPIHKHPLRRRASRMTVAPAPPGSSLSVDGHPGILGAEASAPCRPDHLGEFILCHVDEGRMISRLEVDVGLRTEAVLDDHFEPIAWPDRRNGARLAIVEEARDLRFVRKLDNLAELLLQIGKLHAPRSRQHGQHIAAVVS